MSLNTAAKYLESQGRGSDSRLIHVSPRELQGLEAIARAKGGTLTINPVTGLPEAGILEDVLPVAAAGALMFLAPEAAPFIGEGLGLGSGALGTGVGMGLLAGGAQAATQLLGTGKVDMNSVLRTGVLSGATAGALKGFDMMPSSNVKTDVPALEISKAMGAQPEMLGANPTPEQYAAWDKYLGTNQTPGVTDKTLFANEANKLPAPGEKSWWGSLSPGAKLATGLGGVTLLSMLGQSQTPKIQPMSTTTPMIRPYTFTQTRNPSWGQPGQPYFNQYYTAGTPYAAAQGGLMAIGGPVEQMSAGNQMYPMSQMDKTQYAVPSQMPTSAEVVNADYDAKTNAYTGEPMQRFASGGQTLNPVSQDVLDYQKILENRARDEYINSPQLAAFRSEPVVGLPTTAPTILPISNQGMTLAGGIPNQFIYTPGQGYATNPAYTEYMNKKNEEAMMAAAPQPISNDYAYSGGKAGGLMPYNLGSYSDGGRLLKGPGDGMSDNIPASIADKQPARLADGEFVVPADVVSHLGNGSTDAGAKKLYSMMDKVRAARTGSKKQGKEIKADKYLPT